MLASRHRAQVGLKRASGFKATEKKAPPPPAAPTVVAVTFARVRHASQVAGAAIGRALRSVVAAGQADPRGGGGGRASVFAPHGSQMAPGAGPGWPPPRAGRGARHSTLGPAPREAPFDEGVGEEHSSPGQEQEPMARLPSADHQRPQEVQEVQLASAADPPAQRGRAATAAFVPGSGAAAAALGQAATPAAAPAAPPSASVCGQQEERPRRCEWLRTNLEGLGGVKDPHWLAASLLLSLAAFAGGCVQVAWSMAGAAPAAAAAGGSGGRLLAVSAGTGH